MTVSVTHYRSQLSVTLLDITVAEIIELMSHFDFVQLTHTALIHSFISLPYSSSFVIERVTVTHYHYG